jgi:transposase
MKAPQVIDKTEEEIAAIIKAINETGLPDDTKNFAIQCIELAIWFPHQLKKKAISLSRLRTLLFGKGYKTKETKANQTTTLKPNTNNAETAENNYKDISTQAVQALKENDTSNAQSQPTQAAATPDSKKPGHGRMPHSVYSNYTEIKLTINGMQIGDPCPQNCGGTLREYKPGILVRIRGQNFADVSKYVVEKLRCNLCQALVVADTPADVGTEKYDASFIAMLMLMKYYIAIPFYRQENFQRMLNFPLSDSTQWHLIEPKAGYFYPVYNKLKVYAANGSVLQNDDTKNRILEVIKQIKAGAAGDRTGMYTTGIIALHEGHQIALFMNGRQHSGENVGDILELRDTQKEPVIQMCDALSANIPKEFATILCNCLSHGFRKFEELKDFYGDKCFTIMSMLSKVFDNDVNARDINAEERLAYHREHSQPVMDELEKYMKKLMSEKQVEPNSELAKAIAYMQRHWPKLTRFLTVVGAPIDNNIVERALKIAIRNRKAAMFYRTQYSASIGGMITSIIYTCHLAGENPHHYLVALQTHHSKVLTNPGQWMPWNYQTMLAQEQAADANVQGLSPPEDFPVAA